MTAAVGIGWAGWGRLAEEFERRGGEDVTLDPPAWKAQPHD